MRLFVALTPPPELRARLGELADIAHARCGGRRMPDASLHVTLAFLGEVTEAQAAELVAWVQGLSITPGEWHINRWGSFRRPGIVWLGGDEGAPALQRLQGRLWGTLEPLGVGVRPARYIPHVTLLRRATVLDLDPFPPIALTWSYNQLELIQSTIDERGARYRSLAVSQG
ncbi:RNA 2',3'-cyclic phosphodiesterase [Billgrantia sulfidoxydans]|uniref:RNA 2',3'-cyclic phosphodiesterase n=1 Tax=Billgrantia sulfidoxydans TaxID=2733484 RepID=A0ABX7WBJ2_9GAMM|nr:RNA 2',3'-cyclic phosphodiesterase [Halomonas sulfidoxydans]QTP56852.1 RNA 2',3'-cyclic phosphodiesterase [Halomonas sulfidoxydans]